VRTSPLGYAEIVVRRVTGKRVLLFKIKDR
jgi:hypothetical protein